MRILQLERGKGKTQEAIDTAHAANAYLVVRSRAEANRVFEVARERGKEIHFPITYDDFMTGRFGRQIDAFVIDDVDAMLRKFARGVPVLLATATIEIGRPRWVERTPKDWVRMPSDVDAEWALLDDAGRLMGEVYRITFGPPATAWSFMLAQNHPACSDFDKWPKDLHFEGDASSLEDGRAQLAACWGRLGVVVPR